MLKARLASVPPTIVMLLRATALLVPKPAGGHPEEEGEGEAGGCRQGAGKNGKGLGCSKFA
jgi:hypothetical protein